MASISTAPSSPGIQINNIVSVSVWDTFKIHLFSLVIGLWIVFKRLVKWTLKQGTALEIRDNPPLCLVDSSLGQHNYIKLKGIKFHYVEAGSRHQPLVLLLHGFPDCWLSWRCQIPALAEHFRVIALDLKGFGDSDKPMWRRSYRLDIVLEEIKQFILALGVDRCTIIGHDLGALLGWYLVHIEPDLVDKFVAVSSPHPNIFWTDLPKSSQFNAQWIKFIQWPYLPESEALREDLKIISDCHKHLQSNGSKNIYLEAYKYAFSRKEDWTGPMNYYRNLPFFRINEECNQISVPMTLITGNKDQYVNLESVVRSTDFCEKFQVKIIENAGHFPHQENAEAFNEIILKYLKVHKINAYRSDGKANSKGLMNRMIGAVSTTVKYGNSVLDSVQKKTNGVVNSLPNRLQMVAND